ncbi:hypothetical protein G6F56_013226 [Rhizopus delemar]|nr:hypothetical protein G6F56_013226 [Rhizopus delemar]
MSLSRPLLQSEAGWTKHVTPNTLALFQDEQSWSKVDAKLKSKEYKNINGPSWSSVKEDLNLDSEEGASHSESESSETTRFDAKDMEILGSMPMEEDTVVVKCNNCQRPLLPSRFKEHAEICLGDKLNQMKAFSENEDTNSEKTIKRKYPTDQAEGK